MRVTPAGVLKYIRSIYISGYWRLERRDDSTHEQACNMLPKKMDRNATPPPAKTKKKKNSTHLNVVRGVVEKTEYDRQNLFGVIQDLGLAVLRELPQAEAGALADVGAGVQGQLRVWAEAQASARAVRITQPDPNDQPMPSQYEQPRTGDAEVMAAGVVGARHNGTKRRVRSGGGGSRANQGNIHIK